MKYFVIILSGYTQAPKVYSEIQKVIKEKYCDATILFPDLKLTTFATSSPDDIVASAIKIVDIEWAKEKDPNNVNIIIIGHSTGALLARKLYVVACGENKDAPLGNIYKDQDSPKVWSKYVCRIVLLAGMNRGWTINSHLYSKTAFLMRVGVILGSLMKLVGHEPLVFKTRRGAPFITQLRIQWISMVKHSLVKGVGNVPVIQLLGTKDDIISPEDNIDVLTGSNFIYLEVPKSDHISVLKVLSGDDALKRRIVFENAISTPIEVLSTQNMSPIDDISLKINLEITDVVFVIHGIRDTGYWTQKIARRVKSVGDGPNRKFATETSTYGYFAMLPFLFPFERRRKVEWLMDQYTENLVIYPNAAFSFVGHSNGTYLLAKSLQEYPMCTFKNVVFAGSVVPKQFEWKKMIANKRICNFYNLVASSDWVVAMFPKAFETLKLQDIGSGGFDGFTDQLANNYQLKYVKGGHGSAIEEDYWDDIAHFIVNGNTSASIAKQAVHKRPVYMKILGLIAPLPFLIILISLFFGFYMIYKNTNGIVFLLLAFLYLWILRKIVISL